MLSRYIIILFAIKFWKILFIIVWKVVGLFIILKKYYQEFEKIVVCVKSNLPLGTRLNIDIVEALVQIQFGKILSTLEFCHKLGD